MRGRLIVGLALLAGCGSLPDWGTAAQEATFCPGPTVLQGIDVSYYQGTIDWAAVAAAGYKFAIARTGDGTFMDPKFDQNWQGIKDAGLIRGAYHFFRPNGDPVHQANLMLDRMGSLGPGDLPPVLDVEYTPGAPLPSRSVMVQKIRAWVDRVREVTGLDPIIYTGSYFWDDNVASTEFNGLPLWLPAYSPLCPRLPAPWSEWTFHQYSSEGRVPGISGNVDLNKFNGTQADLNRLAGIGGCTPHCDGGVLVDGGPADGGAVDAGTIGPAPADGGVDDAGMPGPAPADAGPPPGDAGAAPDGGSTSPRSTGGCVTGPDGSSPLPALLGILLVLALGLVRRRRSHR